MYRPVLLEEAQGQAVLEERPTDLPDHAHSGRNTDPYRNDITPSPRTMAKFIQSFVLMFQKDFPVALPSLDRLRELRNHPARAPRGWMPPPTSTTSGEAAGTFNRPAAITTRQIG